MFTKIADWFLEGKSLAANATRHVIIGLITLLILWPIVGIYMGAMFVTGFFLGRERRDHEREISLPVRYFYKGWDIWNWSKGTLVDLIPVVALVWLIVIFFKVF